MTRARRWYERLLGLPPSTISHADRIADLPMLGETQLILDNHKGVVSSSQPLLFFWTDDLPATAEFLQQIAVGIVRPIKDIGSVSALVIKDPDHNLLMICIAMPNGWRRWRSWMRSRPASTHMIDAAASTCADTACKRNEPA